MKLYKTRLMTDAIPGHLIDCDTISWDGKYWIVPKWRDHKNIKKLQPERIILLDALEHQIAAPGAEYHFFLGEAIPRDVFSGQPPEQTLYRVIIQPEIFFDMQELYEH